MKKTELWQEKMKAKEEQAKGMILEFATNYQKNPELIAEFLAFSAKFPGYSPKNVELIYSQNPGACYIQSYDKWKKMGTPVKKGQHGLNVWVPVTVTYLETQHGTIPLSKATQAEKELYQDGKLKSRKSLHFKLGTVFDISQTSFPKEQYPQLLTAGVHSKKHEYLFEVLSACLNEKFQCKVEVGDVSSIRIRGWYRKNYIKINELLNDTQRLSTLTHEMGHHFTLDENDIYAMSPSQAEFEGDAYGIMLQSALGIPIEDTRKAHLAEHYTKFLEELKCNGKKKELTKAIDDAFAHTYDRYQRTWPEIENYLVLNEKKAELKSMEKNNSINLAAYNKEPIQKNIQNKFEYHIPIK